jgi:hypothetical protein
VDPRRRIQRYRRDNTLGRWWYHVASNGRYHLASNGRHHLASNGRHHLASNGRYHVASNGRHHLASHRWKRDVQYRFLGLSLLRKLHV